MLIEDFLNLFDFFHTLTDLLNIGDCLIFDFDLVHLLVIYKIYTARKDCVRFYYISKK